MTPLPTPLVSRPECEWCKVGIPRSADGRRHESIYGVWKCSGSAGENCDVCHGSGEVVFNKHGGDPAWDESKPCPECGADEHGEKST
jgi:hypothetical protein